MGVIWLHNYLCLTGLIYTGNAATTNIYRIITRHTRNNDSAQIDTQLLLTFFPVFLDNARFWQTV